MDRIIVFAMPVFALLIGAEFAWGRTRQRDTYRLADAVSSLSQGLLSQIVAALTQLFQIGLYALVYRSVALLRDDAWWNAWYGWLLAILLYDFCDYWLHRLSHETALLWAAHVVHHQSQDFNFSTALRQESAWMLLGWIFYLPMAICGIPPAQFALAGLIVLVYQFWIHTEHVGKLGWFDRVFSSPSNHRVHHAINRCYMNRNYGGMLVVWDRLFGSFAEEAEDTPCLYGSLPALNSWDPLWAVTSGYWQLAHDIQRAPRWADKLRLPFMPPGWQPAGLAALPRSPAPGRFDPPVTATVAWLGAAQFLLALLGTAAFLWHAGETPWAREATQGASLAAALWVVGALFQGRLTGAGALAIDALAITAYALGS